MNLSSDEFIQKLKSRDEASITHIVGEYHEALFKTALKQGLATDQAEEVVQGTWITFFERIHTFEGRSHIRTYVFGILYNKLKELWRSNKKYTHDYTDEHIEKIFNDDGTRYLNTMDPGIWAQSNEFVSILSEELESLPYNQRVAFQLKEVEGESSEEICRILDISITNLGVLIYRAKHNLRAKLESRFTEEASI